MNTPVLKNIYKDKVVPELKKVLGVENPHQVPAVEKIILSSSIKSDASKEWVSEVEKEKI